MVYAKKTLGAHNSAVIWWVMLRERNARVFEDKKGNIINLKLKSIALLSFWFNKAPNYVLEPDMIVEFF